MSTLKATNIKNESSASNNIVLDSGGGVVVSGVTTFSSAVNFSGSGDITLGTGTTISSPASDTFTVSTNGSEALRVDNQQRVGIGTDSANSKVSLIASGVNGLHLGQQLGVPDNSGRLFFDNATNIWTVYSTLGVFKIASGATIGTSSGTDRLVINSTGALGLSGANYGTSGQVLTSQGSAAAPQWATPAGGAWTYISSVTASNSASVAFTSGIDSTYDTYKIIGTNITHSNGTGGGGYLSVRTSSNGGSSYDSGASDYGYAAINTTLNASNNTGAEINLMPFIGAHNWAPNSIEFTFYTPSAATKMRCSWILNTHSAYSATDLILVTGTGTRENAASVNAIRFAFVTSNISTGTFRLYGIKNS